MQIDLRVVAPESIGAALQYFTGSKEHNVKLRAMAVRKGLKINEYGVFFEGQAGIPGDPSLGGRTEEEVYAALGLPWIPPELREGAGEVELARRGELPRLVELGDLKGDLHLHTRLTDGSSTDRRDGRARRPRAATRTWRSPITARRSASPAG